MQGDLIKFGLAYYPTNVRRCHGIAARGGNNLNVLADNIFSGVMMMELAAWVELLPQKRLKRGCVSHVDRVLPQMVYDDCVAVRRFITAHGAGDDSSPSWVLAIAMMNCGIGMRRTGLGMHHYGDLTARLDSSPPASFRDYIQICIEYEKEMSE